MENQKKNHYVIGTRGSLLALTQCLQVKKQLEDVSGATFSLKVIKTEGDENTSLPLWQLDGKDFFTKELDSALLKGEVDLVVHSYKDLGSERPQGIKLATITKRNFAHDILFIRKEVVKELKNKRKEKLIVGTSSPRRMENITKHLTNFLPFGEECKVAVKTKSLRGNVNSRLEKCLSGEYDAIVLALPGIERLAFGLDNDKNEAFEKFGDPRIVLSGLLKDLDFMVLPLSQFPAAASQGALGIECLESRKDELPGILDQLNDQKTIIEVKKEREYFQSYGGGCHLAVGINATQTEAGLKICRRGKVDDQVVDEIDFINSERTSFPLLKKGHAFIGLSLEKIRKAGLEEIKDLIITDDFYKQVQLKGTTTLDTFNSGDDCLITSPTALTFLKEKIGQPLSTLPGTWFASGAKTMKEMATAGLWVSASCDSLGEDHLIELRASRLLSLILGEKENWKIFTGEGSDSTFGTTISLYEREMGIVPKDSADKIKACTFYYWTSYPQFLAYKKNNLINESAIHSCGIGKTYSRLKKEGVTCVPISSLEELISQLKKSFKK